METDLTGYATLGLAAVTALLVSVTIYHAWQSKHLVDEMRKDRRRQFLENALEKIYSPLYENLRRALNSPDKKLGYHFGPQEIMEIRTTLFERYGHYLDPSIYEKLRKTIIDESTLKIDYQPHEMDSLYNETRERFESLHKELQELTQQK